MSTEAKPQVSETPAWVSERLAADADMAARRAAYDAWARAWINCGTVVSSMPGWVAAELVRREQAGSAA